MSDTRNHLNLIKLGVIVGAITGVLSVAFNYIINKTDSAYDVVSSHII